MWRYPFLVFLMALMGLFHVVDCSRQDCNLISCKQCWERVQVQCQSRREVGGQLIEACFSLPSNAKRVKGVRVKLNSPVSSNRQRIHCVPNPTYSSTCTLETHVKRCRYLSKGE